MDANQTQGHIPPRPMPVPAPPLKSPPQELKYTSEHAKKILGTQERDRQGELDRERKEDAQKLLFSGFCIVVLFVIIVVAMYLGKEKFISDILKVLLGFITGAAGGYSYSKAQARPRQD